MCLCSLIGTFVVRYIDSITVYTKSSEVLLDICLTDSIFLQDRMKFYRTEKKYSVSVYQQIFIINLQKTYFNVFWVQDHYNYGKKLVLTVLNTGHSRYVDFAYLDTTTYVEVIFHSQHFFSIFLCISTPSISKTVNMKQRVSQGDFSYPRRIFYYFCHCLCRSIKSALAWAPYCLLRLCTCISSSKQQ